MDLPTFGKVALVISLVFLAQSVVIHWVALTEPPQGDAYFERYLSFMKYLLPAFSLGGMVLSLGLITGRGWARRGMMALLAAGGGGVIALGLLLLQALRNAPPEAMAPGASREEGYVVLIFITGLFLFMIALMIRYLRGMRGE